LQYFYFINSYLSPRLLLSKCIHFSSAGIENPTGKMAMWNFANFILTINSLFFVVTALKNNFSRYVAIRYALFAYGNGGDLSFILIIVAGICYDFFCPAKYIPTQKR
jgi:hypothetical protein